MENSVPPHFHKTDRIEETDLLPNSRILSALPVTGLEGERCVVLSGSTYTFYQYLNGSWRVSSGTSITIPLPVNQGGTGATTAAGARTNLSAADVSHSHSEGDLSLSAVTTNNVSITKHGFTPVLPNDATKFLNGVGAYAVPTGSGIIIKGGTFSKVMSSTTTDTIPHGLGKMPVFIEILLMYGPNGYGAHVISQGFYDGTNQDCIFFGPFGGGSAVDTGSGGGAIIAQFWTNTSSNNQASAAMDATNINLTWTIAGSPLGTAYFIWKAYG